MGIYDRPYYQDDSSPSLAPSWDQKSAIATIIIVCTVLFVANMFFSGQQWTKGLVPDVRSPLTSFLSLYVEDLQQPWMLWRTLTYGFVHSNRDIMHIVFNMLGLWMLGRAVEERYGRAEFFRIFILAVILCGILWLALRWLFGERASICGASGAVCCIEMLYVLNFPRSTLMLLGVLPIQAWVFGIFFIIMSAMVGTGVKGARVAWDVHLIGIGLAFVYFYGKWNLSFLAALTIGWRLIKRKMFGPRLKAFQPTDRAASDEAEADRILDKIHRLGQDSLTSKEKRFMTNYSKTVRNKRQNTSS